MQAEQEKGLLNKPPHATNHVELIDKSLELRVDFKYFAQGASDYTCKHYIHVGATSCDTLETLNGDFLTQVVVDPVGTPTMGESIAFVIAYDAETEKDAALVGNTFIRGLLEHSPWLAKRVVLLFVPSHCNTLSSKRNLHICNPAHGRATIFSTALEQWLHLRTNGTIRGNS